jgi:tRNA (cytosine49-C5)-methyltransferase
MKRRQTAERLEQKRNAWIERTAAALAVSPETAERLLATERRQSLRLNPLRRAPQETLRELRELGWDGVQYTWMPLGLSRGSLAGASECGPVMRGEAYIQNAASWLPVLALDPKPGEYVLDACAAPGGKASHIAALTDGQAHLWLNDSSKARLIKMQANLARLGVAVDNYTLFDAQHLARKLSGQQFDRILIDAPCSGEGLRNIEREKDVLDWSVAHIKRLQQEQRRILNQAWQLLKIGGTVVYSTCTIAPEENEGVVDFLLRGHADAAVIPIDIDLPNRVTPVRAWNGRAYDERLQDSLRLAPSPDIEAFFVCKLQKLAPNENEML